MIRSHTFFLKMIRPATLRLIESLQLKSLLSTTHSANRQFFFIIFYFCCVAGHSLSYPDVVDKTSRQRNNSIDHFSSKAKILSTKKEGTSIDATTLTLRVDFWSTTSACEMK